MEAPVVNRPEQMSVDSTSDAAPAASYPMSRGGCPMHPPAALTKLRSGPSASRVTLWEGSEVWLVTAYEEVRAILGDRRFTAVTSAPGFPMMTPASKVLRSQPKSASFIRMDDPDHSRLRSMLTRHFLPRAAEELRPRIATMLDSSLSRIRETAERPVDLVSMLALPVASRVIAMLLGIPVEDEDFFEKRSAVLIDRGHTIEEITTARDDLDAYLRRIVQQRVKEPADDLISQIVVERANAGNLDVEELVPMFRLLLVAGHGTTASQVSLSLLSLLSEPELRSRLRDEPTHLPQAVDELLRFHSIVQNGLARAATEDVTVGDIVIRAGEGVVLSLSAANRDPERFPLPDELDADRDARRHLAFGHGVHQCLGQWLAKVEVEEILAAVLRWMPDAELAVPAEELEFRHEVSSYGLVALPVTW